MSTGRGRAAAGLRGERQSLGFSIAAGVIGTALCSVVLVAVASGGFAWSLMLFGLLYVAPPQAAFVAVNAVASVSAPVRVLLCLLTIAAILAVVGFAIPLGSPIDQHYRLESVEILLVTALPAILGFWLLAWFFRWVAGRGIPQPRP